MLLRILYTAYKIIVTTEKKLWIAQRGVNVIHQFKACDCDH